MFLLPLAKGGGEGFYKTILSANGNWKLVIGYYLELGI
jgi:hypothetical protein